MAFKCGDRVRVPSHGHTVYGTVVEVVPPQKRPSVKPTRYGASNAMRKAAETERSQPGTATIPHFSYLVRKEGPDGHPGTVLYWTDNPEAALRGAE